MFELVFGIAIIIWFLALVVMTVCYYIGVDAVAFVCACIVESVGLMMIVAGVAGCIVSCLVGP